MTKPTMLLFALLLTVAPSCGGSDDDCYWERRCESIGGQLTCVWVKLCPGDEGYGAGDGVTYPIEAPPANETWDVRIGRAAAEGTSPLVAHVLGDDVVESVDGDRYRGWRVRLVLITEGLCELGVANAVLLTEQDVDVAGVSER